MNYNLLLVLFVPALLIAADQEWLFPRGNPTDNWLNYSYFFEYGKQVSGLLHSYKTVRLAWIWKGWFFFHVFPPLVAYYLLHISIFFTCIVAFFYCAKTIFDEDAAVFGTLAFETYSQFHNVVSFEWDYHTHDAAANILLTILCLALAAKRPGWRWLLVLSGVAAACAFQSPYNVGYLPALAIIYFFLNLKYRRNPLIASILLAAAGGVGMTLVFCIVNYAIGGPFLYFSPEIGYTWHVVSDVAYDPGYWIPLSRTFVQAKGVVMPAYIAIATVAVVVARLVRGRESGASDEAVICTAAFLSALSVNAYIQYIGHPFLSDDHMVVELAPLAFLAAAGVFQYLLAHAPGESLRWGAKVSTAALFSGVLLFQLPNFLMLKNLVGPHYWPMVKDFVLGLLQRL